MPKPLHEQVVVITGASSGIGRETALQFGRAGAAVVLAARNTTALEAVARDIRDAGGRAHVFPVDVADFEAMQSLAREAVETFGSIDTWVNNAGTSVYATFDETDMDEFKRVVEVDLMGEVHGVKAVLPYFKAQNGGTIINVGSVLSKRSVPLQAAYCAAKHGVKGFTEALRLELARDYPGINVTLVMPSSINTPFFDHARSKLDVKPMPIPPVYPPSVVARVILDAAQHPTRDAWAGGAGVMFSVLNKISPALMDRFMMVGNWIFRSQTSSQPNDNLDTLFTPMENAGRVEGEFDSLTKPGSAYTRIFELTPTWVRLVVPAALVGLIALIRRR